MSRIEIDQIQRKNAAEALLSLAMTCRTRFLRAASLLEIGSEAINTLRAFGSHASVDVAPLMPAWQCLCDRYVSERYSAQLSLLRDGDSDLTEDWGKFLYHEMFPTMLRDDSLVRNVLRALGGLPCASTKQAAGAVRQHILEMTLPSSPPLWALGEIVE
jgi:hypothetical protein